MNKDHLKLFVAVYTNRINVQKETEQRNHVKWMLTRLSSMLRQKSKLNRWVGFIQGYCWTKDLFSVETMRWHIRDFSKPGKPLRCKHEVIAEGPRTPMVHGSAPTRVCTECGSYRIMLHTESRWQPGPVETESDEEEE